MVWKTERYTGWGRALSAEGELARPERVSALVRISQESPAPAIGNRRSYGDAPLNSGGRAIDMTRLNRILGFDADTGILNVEAGVQIGEIARIFAPRGWLPAVMPGTGFATVGGCIAQDVHGKNHHGVGSFGCHVKSITLILNGKPKVVSPEKNKGLFKATVGGVGQTGRIIEGSLSGMWHMITGAISTCNISGPIGIAETSGAMASQGAQNFIFFIAVLSTAVGLLNLFPIPALDGGHLVFYAYEAVSGKPPSDKALRILMTLGIAVVLSLMVFSVSNDLFC